MQRVLKIEEVFRVGKRGVLVLPYVPLSFFEGKRLPQLVELRLPDGSIKSVAAHFGIPRRSPQPAEYEFVCQLPNIEASSVPIGAEIWAVLEEPAA
jgi:hypothetical protein